jgi:dTDP-4-dehydrorhamnose reductase
MMLVTGAAGQLGTALRKLIPDATFVDVDEIDLTRLDVLEEALDRMDPDGIINCAAYNAVDRAEEEEDLATLVNAGAVRVMAVHAAAAGIPFVTFSTDYVFAGDAKEPYLESSPTNPVSAYGRSKLAGEEAALGVYPRSLVIRTSWLVSGTHPNFVATMLRLARERVVRVVNDQRGCPTMVNDLAPAALRALDAGASGVLHLTNSGVTTWYGFAREAVALAGIDPDRIEPCTTDEYPTAAHRPAYSVLGSERRGALGIEDLPAWQESLPAVVEELTS